MLRTLAVRVSLSMMPMLLIPAPPCFATTPPSAPSAGTVPLIHCTDLLHPPDDPDDYFDLAAVYAVPEFDLKYVILDQGEKQKDRPGTIPVEQLNRLTGRTVPAAIGLSEKLKSPADKGLEQPKPFQAGVEAILKVLRETTSPVAISVVGSARDLTAAWNREPELLKAKISRVYVFAGEASAKDPKFVEWNVQMDPASFAGLMRADLPLVWIPCFDHDAETHGVNASYWQTTHSLLLDGAPEPLLQYFVNATQSVTSHPLEFVSKPMNPEHRTRLMSTPRNMWGGAVLALMAGRTIARQGDFWRAVPAVAHRAGVEGGETASPVNGELVGFAEHEFAFNDEGLVDPAAPGKKKVLLFHVHKPDLFAPALNEATADLLRQFPITR